MMMMIKSFFLWNHTNNYITLNVSVCWLLFLLFLLLLFVLFKYRFVALNFMMRCPSTSSLLFHSFSQLFWSCFSSQYLCYDITNSTKQRWCSCSWNSILWCWISCWTTFFFLRMKKFKNKYKTRTHFNWISLHSIPFQWFGSSNFNLWLLVFSKSNYLFQLWTWHFSELFLQ